MISVQNKTDLQTAFDAQRRYASQMALTTVDQRLDRIRRVQTWINAHEAEIQRAMYDDFRKPAAEVLMRRIDAVTARNQTYHSPSEAVDETSAVAQPYIANWNQKLCAP